MKQANYKVQEYLDRHQENKDILSGDYKQAFSEIINGNLCSNPIVNVSLLPQPCEQLFNNASVHVSILATDFS